MTIKEYLSREVLKKGAAEVSKNYFNILLVDVAKQIPEFKLDEEIIKISEYDQARAMELVRVTMKIGGEFSTLCIHNGFDTPRIHAILKAFNSDKGHDYWMRFIDTRFNTDLINLLISLSKTQPDVFYKILDKFNIFNLNEDAIDLLVIAHNMNINIDDYYTVSIGFCLDEIDKKVKELSSVKNTEEENNTKNKILDFLGMTE